MKVKIQYLNDMAVKPEYATAGSAGMDLCAAMENPVELKVGGRAMIPTGIAMQIPEGYGGFVFPRSGLAYKKGISMANCVGVIDSDYTGEIKVETGLPRWYFCRLAWLSFVRSTNWMRPTVAAAVLVRQERDR